jgi:hypothetical protein
MHVAQMIADLFARGAVAIAQFPPDVFPGLCDKREYRLKAFLALVLWVVALASAHLLAVDGMHRGVGVDGDDRQLHIGTLLRYCIFRRFAAKVSAQLAVVRQSRQVT